MPPRSLRFGLRLVVVVIIVELKVVVVVGGVVVIVDVLWCYTFGCYCDCCSPNSLAQTLGVLAVSKSPMKVRRAMPRCGVFPWRL